MTIVLPTSHRFHARVGVGPSCSASVSVQESNHKEYFPDYKSCHGTDRLVMETNRVVRRTIVEFPEAVIRKIYCPRLLLARL